VYASAHGSQAGFESHIVLSAVLPSPLSSNPAWYRWDPASVFAVLRPHQHLTSQQGQADAHHLSESDM
jgi:hypothetical protein